jgi:hypothetical protein
MMTSLVAIDVLSPIRDVVRSPPYLSTCTRRTFLNRVLNWSCPVIATFTGILYRASFSLQ